MFKKIRLWITSFFGNKKEEVKEEKKPVATQHAKDRLIERHGEVLTDQMIDAFVQDIKSKKAKFLKNTRNSTQAWVVTYDNKKYRVIYNYRSEVIVTVYRNIKNKFVKPNRRKKNKKQKRIHTYDAYRKREKTKFKKLYKRKKRVEYSEYSEMI